MQHVNVVIVPGYGGIDHRHWLAHWKSNHPQSMRLAEYDPRDLSCRSWVRGIEDAVSACGERTSLVAHGVGCFAVAHWAAVTNRSVDAAMLVSVPNPDGGGLPPGGAGFSPVPRSTLPFRTLLVASEAEGDYQHVLTLAEHWDATMVVVGSISHTTGPKARQTWDEGLGMLWNLASPAFSA